jgi:hypothetical protein
MTIWIDAHLSPAIAPCIAVWTSTMNVFWQDRQSESENQQSNKI